MKKIKIGLIVFLTLASMPSCVESEYHWDNLNREGIIELPPIPLGAFEPIVIKDLNETEIIIPELPSGTYPFSYSLRNLFGTSSIKNFFHDYMKRNISIQGKLVMNILGENSGISVDIDFEPLDENDKVIQGVDIKGLKNVRYGVHDLFIIIPKENGAKMKNAEHLRMKIKMTTPSNITLTEGDYIQLSNMIIKTAGYLVDL